MPIKSNIAQTCKNLNCLNNGVCNPGTLKCDCTPGFNGTSCEICKIFIIIFKIAWLKCDLNIHSLAISSNQSCIQNGCKNYGTCSSITGQCLCNQGYTGLFCETSRSF